LCNNIDNVKGSNDEIIDKLIKIEHTPITTISAVRILRKISAEDKINVDFWVRMMLNLVVQAQNLRGYFFYYFVEKTSEHSELRTLSTKLTPKASTIPNFLKKIITLKKQKKVLSSGNKHFPFAEEQQTEEQKSKMFRKVKSGDVGVGLVFVDYFFDTHKLRYILEMVRPDAELIQILEALRTGDLHKIILPTQMK
jgi:hypothetical protein